MMSQSGSQEPAKASQNFSFSQGLTQGGSRCCVHGCSSTKYSHPHLSFYGFPKRDKAQTEAWTRAVNRQNPDDTKGWVPKSSSKICSAHFHAGMKSNNPDSRSYLPSIFPTSHTKLKTEEDQGSFERAAKRSRDRETIVKTSAGE